MTASFSQLVLFLFAVIIIIVALSIGVLLAFNCKRTWNRREAGKLLQDAAEKAGGILVIIGACRGYAYR
jgi:gluconate:H+ symporter, GntP family